MSQRVLLPLLLVLVTIKLALNHLSDPDLFWHLRLGMDMLDSGSLPVTVGYNWPLAGRPYLPNDWLAEILLATAFRIGGFVLLSMFKAMLCVTLVLVLYAVALRRNGGNARGAALAVFLVSLVATSNFTLRPVLFGMLCLAGVLYTCEQLARGRRAALIALPVLFGIWINVHGSWPVGLGAVVAFAAGVLVPVRFGRLGPREGVSGVRPLALLAVPLAAMGLLVNPVGGPFLQRPFRLIGHYQDIAVFKEWGPVPLNDLSAWTLAAVLLVSVVALLCSRRRIVHAELGFVAVAAWMASRTALYHIAFAVAVTPLLAEHLSARIAAEGLSNRLMNAIVFLFACLLPLPLAGLKLLHWRSEVRSAEPVDAVSMLERLPQSRQRGFNYFDWGGYLVFRGIPSYIDGRLEPFIESGLFSRYFDLERTGDVGALESDGVAWALVRTGSTMANHLANREGWQRVTADAMAELYVRDRSGAVNESVRQPLPGRANCQPWCEGLGGS